MSSFDRLVSAVRTWLEDRTPWYDRAAEMRAAEHTEQVTQKSVAARQLSERVHKGDEQLVAAVRNTVAAIRK